jgi:hypothetical protein
VTPWFKCEEDTWAEAVEHFPPVWSEGLARADLAYWQRQVDRGARAKAPGRRTLAERWGWTEWAVRELQENRPTTPAHQKPAQAPPTFRPLPRETTPTLERIPPTSRPLPAQTPPAPLPESASKRPPEAPLEREKRDKNSLPTTKARGEGAEANRETVSIAAVGSVVGREGSSFEVLPSTRLASIPGMPDYIATSLAREAQVHTLADLASYTRDALAAVWSLARGGRLDALERWLRRAELAWAVSSYAPRAAAPRPAPTPPWMEKPSAGQPRVFEFEGDLERYLEGQGWLIAQTWTRIRAAGGGAAELRTWLGWYVHARHLDAALSALSLREAA